MSEPFDPKAFAGPESTFDPKAFINTGEYESPPSNFMDTADNVWDGFWGSVHEKMAPYLDNPTMDAMVPPPVTGDPVSQAGTDIQAALGAQEPSDPLNPASVVGDAITNVATGPAKLSNMFGRAAPFAGKQVKDYLQSQGASHITQDAGSFIASAMADPRTYLGVNDTNSNLLQIDPLAEQRAGEALAQSVELTPAQATQSKALSLLEGFGNRYIFSTGTFDKFYGPQLEAWHGIAKKILSKFGDSPALDAIKEEGAHRVANYLNAVAPEDRTVMADLSGNSMGDMISNLEVGQYQKSVIEQTTKKANDAFHQRYDDVGKILPPDNVVPVPGWKQAAEKIRAEQTSLTKTGMENKALLTHVTKVIGDDGQSSSVMMAGVPVPKSRLSEYFKNNPDLDTTPMDPPSYSDIQANLRSYTDNIQKHDIAAKFNSNSPMMGDTISGSYKTLSSALRKDVANYVNDIGTKAKTNLADTPPKDPQQLADMQNLAEFPDKFNKLRYDYAASKKAFNDPLVTKWLKGTYQPGKISQDSLNNMGNVLDLLDPKDRVPIQQNVLTQLMTNPKTGTLDSGYFMNNIDKLGVPALMRVIPPEVFPEIAHSQGTLRAMGSAATMAAQPSETARGLMTAGGFFKTTNALLDLAFGRVGAATKGLAKVVGIPNLLAKVYLSQPARELFIKGLSFPSASGAALNLLRNGAVIGALTNKGRSDPRSQDVGQTDSESN